MRLLQKTTQMFQRSPRRFLILLFVVLFITYVVSAIYHRYKDLPQDMDYTGKVHHANIEVLIDDSRVQHGQVQLSQQIFNRMLQMIQDAGNTLVLDMFLFNDLVGQQANAQNWAEQFTYALIQKRREFPQMNIVIMADPVNSVYGGVLPQHYAQLKQAGIEVYEPNLADLPASNPIWTGFWAMCCQNIANSPSGWLASPFQDGQKVTLRSYLHLLNFKANHRKVMLIDSAQGWQSLISSANIHDGSSRHRNIAVMVYGDIASEVLNSENVVAKLSNTTLPSVIFGQNHQDTTLPKVQLLTEKAIYRRAIEMIEKSEQGDHLAMMMFYLSERNIIQALKNAHQRGVNIRILLDQNRDAFGRAKNGIPNQPVAHELAQAGIAVRWCHTQGEQCHAKVLIKQHLNEVEVLTGSANFTRRNLQNFNLETDVWIATTMQNPQIQRLQRYFNQSWQNEYGLSSLDYSENADDSTWKKWQYRFMEWSGISTF